MVKNLICSTAFGLFLAGFNPVSAQGGKQSATPNPKQDLKFLDDISVSIPAAPVDPKTAILGIKVASTTPLYGSRREIVSAPALDIESASTLQLKYAILLDTEVEQVLNLPLFQNIEEWYGTRYRYGGTSKSGIDCSAFVQTLYTAYYGMSLPRTAREQYEFSRPVSRTELKEGDLVFFNTTGGVSHVGMYLQNNKFVHAASSAGVMISDLYEDYWLKRFVGVGRIEKSPAAASGIFSQP